jgi:hypothetical protein
MRPRRANARCLDAIETAYEKLLRLLETAEPSDISKKLGG